jgi:lysyl-tRNA synthetase class 2
MAAPLDGAVPGRAQMFVIGLVLLNLARGLIHRRWAAWLGSVSTLAVATAISLPQHRPAAVVLAGGALVVLVMLRDRFVTRPDPARIRVAAVIAAGSLATATVCGAWDAVANHRAYGGAGRLVLADLSSGRHESWRAEMLTLALAIAVVAAVIVALAPAAAPQAGNARERATVGALAARPGADSLAPFATRADKSYVFSPDRAVVIGYRVLLGTALAGGDPVGASSSVPDAMRAFLAVCAEHGWRPAVLGASDEMASRWRELGLHGLHIGDEAILPIEEFSLASRRMRNLRQAVNRTRNAGVRVAIGPLTTEHAAQLAPILADWLHGARERGFAMNLDSILDPRPDCLVATAYSAGGEAVAFARFAVCADGSVYTLDVAPRGRTAPNGVAERMIVEIVEYAREHGGREVSLNFAGLRWVFESTGLLARASAWLLHALDRWIEIGPLNRFAGKFAPRWRARSLLMGSWWELGWVAAAALRAELGAGPLPRQRQAPATETDQAGATDLHDATPYRHA